MTSRLKERGGAGGKVLPSNPHLPFIRTLPPSKENPSSTSAVKSTLPRLVSAVRRSTSSIPTPRLPPAAHLDPKGSDSSRKGGVLNGIARREPERRSVSVGRSGVNSKADLLVPDAKTRKPSPLAGDIAGKKMRAFGVLGSALDGGRAPRGSEGERRSVTMCRSNAGNFASVTASSVGRATANSRGDLSVFNAKVGKEMTLVVDDALVARKEGPLCGAEKSEGGKARKVSGGERRSVSACRNNTGDLHSVTGLAGSRVSRDAKGDLSVFDPKIEKQVSMIEGGASEGRKLGAFGGLRSKGREERSEGGKTSKVLEGERRSVSVCPNGGGTLASVSGLATDCVMRNMRGDHSVFEVKEDKRTPLVDDGCMKVGKEEDLAPNGGRVKAEGCKARKVSGGMRRSDSMGRSSCDNLASLTGSAAACASGDSKGDLLVFDSNIKKQVPLADNHSPVGGKEGALRNLASNGGTEKSIVSGITGCNAQKLSEGADKFENEMKSRNNEVGVSDKYPSRLREKLALLEGKVQKIATDIRKTKEMLDSNSTDASKMMLSDIQKKISGIEKAVGNVVSGSQAEIGFGVSVKGENPNTIIMEEIEAKDDQIKDVSFLKNSAKVLNEKDLEARLFPHQKLLKHIPLRGTLVEQVQPLKTSAKENNCDAVYENDMGNTDEDPIALEFLASLKDGQTKISLKNKFFQTANAFKEMGSEDAGSLGGHYAHNDFVSNSQDGNVALVADEKLDDFDDQENKPMVILKEDSEDLSTDRMFDVGDKTSTGGWFVSEGEGVLLAHSDGSCSYFDIGNNEEKAQYEAPPGISNNLWGDCWLIRAPGIDGCSGKYVVAASAGNTLESGFCSWDFYKKDIQAFRLEPAASNPFPALSSSSSRMVLAPLSNVDTRRRPSMCMPPSEVRQWWYRPCGYLILATSSKQNIISAYDVRDGALSMTWATHSPVASMEYSCPLQWRSRGKVIIAETESLCLWDVNSLNPQPLRTVSCDGKKVLALHVSNTDAEVGGGVRQRVSSTEVEGNDGIFCTADSINVFDHRHPSGVGLSIPTSGLTPHTVFTRGDSILLGCSNICSESRPASSSIQSFSIRKARLAATYSIPKSSGAHQHHSSLVQVWGNSNLVMGVSGMGLSVFDTVRDDGLARQCVGGGDGVPVKEMVGPDDLYRPSFDYIGGRVLVISRDRPAMWRYLL